MCENIWVPVPDLTFFLARSGAPRQRSGGYGKDLRVKYQAVIAELDSAHYQFGYARNDVLEGHSRRLASSGELSSGRSWSRELQRRDGISASKVSTRFYAPSVHTAYARGFGCCQL